MTYVIQIYTKYGQHQRSQSSPLLISAEQRQVLLAKLETDKKLGIKKEGGGDASGTVAPTPGEPAAASAQTSDSVTAAPSKPASEPAATGSLEPPKRRLLIRSASVQPQQGNPMASPATLAAAAAAAPVISEPKKSTLKRGATIGGSSGQTSPINPR